MELSYHDEQSMEEITASLHFVSHDQTQISETGGVGIA
jgi:hypothetical protein